MDIKTRALEISRKYQFSGVSNASSTGVDQQFMKALERGDHLTEFEHSVRRSVNESIIENWSKIRKISDSDALKFLVPIVRQKSNCSVIHAVDGIMTRFKELEEVNKSAKENSKRLLELLRSTTAEEVRQ